MALSGRTENSGVAGIVFNFVYFSMPCRRRTFVPEMTHALSRHMLLRLYLLLPVDGFVCYLRVESDHLYPGWTIIIGTYDRSLLYIPMHSFLRDPSSERVLAIWSC